MKRQIKFRAWNKRTNKMVDLLALTPLALSDTMNDQLALQGMSGLFIPFSNEFELMQFTGLKTREGNDIYENDILKRVEHDSYVVLWKKDGYIARKIYDHWTKQHVLEKEQDVSLSSLTTFNIIISGNQFENPELL